MLTGARSKKSSPGLADRRLEVGRNHGAELGAIIGACDRNVVVFSVVEGGDIATVLALVSASVLVLGDWRGHSHGGQESNEGGGSELHG